MPEFLKLHSLSEATEKYWKALQGYQPAVEEVDTREALGRVTAEDIFSAEFLPSFTRSTHDGYAVQAASTFGASESLPSYLNMIGEVPMGSIPEFKIKQDETALIHTGGMLPEGADSVVMLEQTQVTPSKIVEILKPVTAGENTLVKGEDVKPGDVVIPAGVKLRPAEIGGLLALGILKVKVTQKPVVGLLSSGDEVVAPEKDPLPGQVRDINSYTLAALVEQAGGIPKIYPIMPDNSEKIQKEMKEALKTVDILIATAGSSASTRDMTVEVMQSLGEPGVLVHGINIKPGKPTILAVCSGKPLVGLPGNPVSALVIAHLIVRPLVEKCSGMKRTTIDAVLQATLAVNLSSVAGREDYYPVKLIRHSDKWIAEPIFFKSNLIYSLARADGLVHIYPDQTGVMAGEIVEVVLI